MLAIFEQDPIIDSAQPLVITSYTNRSTYMKKYLLIAPVLLLAACAQTPMPMNSSMQNNMMSGGCSCCQKMMKDGSMDMSMMKDGKMQCSMMGNASKGGMKCGCCEKMMDSEAISDSQKTSTPPAPVKDIDHTQHHPSK